MRKYKTSLSISVVILSVCSFVRSNAQPSTSQNFILTNTVKQAGITTEPMVNNLPITTQGKTQSVVYFDGLGRPLQNVITQGSATQKDIITGIEYDQFGREVKKYLPYSDNTGTAGSYKSGWKTAQASFYNGAQTNVDVDTAPYSQAVIEPSPLNRLEAQGAIGTTWQPNLSNPYDAASHSVRTKYLVNTTLDSVRMLNMDSAGNYSSPGYYPAGQLYLKISLDEQGQMIKEYTDKSDRIVCKRVEILNDSLQTYYIYDNMYMLRAVIQPEGIVALKTNNWVYPTGFANKWMFLYRYDQRGRTVMKKVPGADSVVMMYDQWDRLVLTQDGNLRTGHNFIFIKYDVLNRPIVTGQITDTRSLNLVQADVMSSTGRYDSVNTSVNEGYTLNASFPSSSSYTLTVYTTTHYDDYNNLPSWKSSYGFVNEDGIAAQNIYLHGEIVATQTRILGTSNFMRTVTYYDDKYRVIQTTADNAAGGADRITKILSFDGKVISDYHSHTSRFYTTPLLVQQTYNYDHVDRLLQVTHQTGSQEVVTLAQDAYNEVGQLLNKKIHQSPSHPNALQTLDYYYNIRGWLNGVNRPLSTETGYDESDLFSFELHYGSTTLNGARAQFNGNIAEQLWKSGYDEYRRGYLYLYDQANRLDTSSYARFTAGGVWSYTKKYDENHMTYDHNGNLKTLARYHGDFAGINSLGYLNYSGNQLGNTWDFITNTSPVGFHDHNNGSSNDYTYDANGNTTMDYNKGITAIAYNFLNLPTLVTIPGKGTIAYTYDAAGNKLQKTTTDQASNVINYYYASDFIYRNDTLEFVSHPEGRLRPVRIDTTQAISIANLKYIYDYFMKDHLGSVRSVLSTEQETDMYAATMETANATKENALFSNISSTATTKPGGFDSDGSNGQVSRLNGEINTSPNKRVGPSIVLKVMAGDTVSISTYAWYTGATQQPPNDVTSIANDVLTLLTGGVVGDNGTKGGSISTTTINSLLTTVVSNFLTTTQTYNNTRPKAFLNWMVVDEEFFAVSSANHLGAIQVPLISGGTQKQQLVGPTNMVIRRNGWLYVYVSNEANQDVYFDDLTINHKRGPLVEQKDYYAFGLEIPGLSTQAAKYHYDNNRAKFNGIEYDTAFSFDKYEARYRDYDPEIARWTTIDPSPDQTESSYIGMSNNPILYSDPLGDTLVDGQGKAITYSINRNGTIKWSRNVTADWKRVGNAMAKTKIGLKELNSMESVNYGITMKIDKNTTSVEKWGNTDLRGQWDSKTKTFTPTKATITIYEAKLTEFSKAIQSGKIGGDEQGKLYAFLSRGNDMDDMIGAVGTHEAIHSSDVGNIKEQMQNFKLGLHHDLEKLPEKTETDYLNQLIGKILSGTLGSINPFAEY